VHKGLLLLFLLLAQGSTRSNTDNEDMEEDDKGVPGENKEERKHTVREKQPLWSSGKRTKGAIYHGQSDEQMPTEREAPGMNHNVRVRHDAHTESGYSVTRPECGSSTCPLYWDNGRSNPSIAALKP
jgi:hypothetical protein